MYGDNLPSATDVIVLAAIAAPLAALAGSQRAPSRGCLAGGIATRGWHCGVTILVDERISTIMPAARLPVRDDRGGTAVGDLDLLAADLGRFPAVWPEYQRGLHEVYSGIGAGDLAIGPELPAYVTTVVVARTPGKEMVGGVLLRERTEIARYAGLAQIAAAIAERVPDGVNEIGGCWIRPAWQGAGLGTALIREVVRAAAGAGRWTVTLANQSSIGLAMRAGFVPDARFRDLPFPDSRFRSALCWFDHDGEGR